MSAGRNLLRVALAMVLFLAGVAGARLQGETTALRAALGEARHCLPGGGESPEGRGHSHDSCVLCGQFAGDAPVLAGARLHRTAAGRIAADARDLGVAASPTLHYAARGPPFFV